jgi:hypothetical protein
MTEIPVAALTRRLTDTPQDFLADPDDVSVPAVVSDVLLMAGGTPLDARSAARFAPSAGLAKRRLVLVACWLLADEELLAAAGRRAAERIWRLLADELDELAGLVDAHQFVRDPDRREELARIALRALRVTPAGETPAQTADRLSAVDSVRRHQAFVAAREAEKRAQEVRRKMEEQRAREAAARYSQV